MNKQDAEDDRPENMAEILSEIITTWRTIMQPDELKKLVTSLAVAADVVDAIDHPILQQLRGWHLANWTYASIPWGVRFLRRDTYENAIDVAAITA